VFPLALNILHLKLAPVAEAARFAPLMQEAGKVVEQGTTLLLVI